jgi:hypothetical protein
MFTGPSEVAVKPVPVHPVHYTEKRNAFESDGTQSELPIRLIPKSPGVYKCRIVLIGKDIPDIRIYNLIVTVKLEALRANLEFTVPARQCITQDIPFQNNSGEDWTIKVRPQYLCCK